MDNSSIDYKKKSLCFNELLSADRQDWDRFHENFVRILVEFGYEFYLTSEGKQWYEENKDEEYSQQ